MTAFFAIVRLTCRSLVRSRVFQLLLAALFATIVALPMTVVGDGTALAHIQVSLKYSLGAVGMILSISAIWVGCSVMGEDVVSRRLHLVVAKPVSRWLVWFSKWAGVVVAHGVLLALAGGMVYALVLWRFDRSDFSKSEKERIRGEILTGRAVFMPERPPIEELTRKELEKRLSRLSPDRSRGITSERREELLWQVRKDVVASLGGVPPGRTRLWRYTGLDPSGDSSIFLRYRVYVGKVDSSGQRGSKGMWLARVNLPAKSGAGKGDDGKKESRTVFVPHSMYPEDIPCGSFAEMRMTPKVVFPDGSVVVGFTNYDPGRKPLFFQPKDGPKLLVEETGFLSNYLRALLVLFAKIAFLAGVACAAGGLFSTPVAIFGVVSYILAGSFSAYLLGVRDWIFESSGMAGKETLLDIVGNTLSEFLLLFIIPIQNFEVSGILSNGELITWVLVAKIVLLDAVLRGAPLMALGAWLYSRRELGLVTGK